MDRISLRHVHVLKPTSVRVSTPELVKGSPPQAFIRFFIRVVNRDVVRLPDQVEIVNKCEIQRISPRALVFDLHILESLKKTYQKVSTLLSEQGIIQKHQSTIIKEIHRYGYSKDLTPGTPVFPLYVTILVYKDHIEDKTRSTPSSTQESGNGCCSHLSAMDKVKRKRESESRDTENGVTKERALLRRGQLCRICLEELRADLLISNQRRMPCSHAFHGACIVTWLKNNHHCPVCRLELPRSYYGNP